MDKPALTKFLSSYKNTVLAVFTAIFAAFVVCFPLTNTDIWWHLATAREMLKSGAFLFQDPFSFTPSSDLWINLHWIFQLVTYGIHKLTGVAGLVAAKCLLFSLAWVILLYAIPGRKAAWFSVFILSVLAFQGRYLVLVRPAVFSLLFMAVFIFCLERYLQRGKRSYLLYLLPLQVIWANSQGLFILGPVIFGLYAAGEIADGLLGKKGIAQPLPRSRITQQKPLELPLLAGFSLLACVINPYGTKGLWYPFRLFARINATGTDIYSDNVSENMPFFSLLAEEPAYIYAVLIASTLLAVSFFYNREKVRIPHVLLCLAFLYLALLAKRNIILFYVTAAPILCCYLPGCRLIPARVRGRAVKTGLKIFAAAVLAYLGTAHASVIAISPKAECISPFRYPGEAVEYLRQYPVSGHMFNSIRDGGYLIWNLYPSGRVFIDGRLIIRSPMFFGQYLKVLDHPELFHGIRQKHDITHVLLPTAIFYRYLNLARALYKNPDWRLVHTNGSSVLFVLDSLARTPALDVNSEETVENIRRRLLKTWHREPYIREEAQAHLGRMLLALGAFSGADQVFSSMKKD
ncbi:hypothetical protein ACFL5V_01425 [Fibrobacterota bacterium]